MKKILDVNLHKKLKRKKRIKRYIVVFFVFISFFAVIFIVWQVSLKRFILKDNGKNFPILFSGDSVLGFEKTKNGFCVLTNSYFNFYRKDGCNLKSIANISPKTQIVGIDGKVLFYEKGAKNFSIYEDCREIFSGVLENPIVFGKIFKNNYYAFVTNSENYSCELVIYNNKNRQIFKWSSAKNYIVDFDILKDSNKCIVATFGTTKEGICKSFIYELDFKSCREKIKKDFLNKAPIAIKKFGSFVVFVCDSTTFFINYSTNDFKTIDYGKNLLNFELMDGGYFVGYFKNFEKDNFSEILMVYDKFGDKKAEYRTNEKIRKIKSFDGDILILTDEHILHSDVNLKKINKIKNFDGVEDIIYEKPYLYFVSMNKLNRFLLK